LPLAAEKVPARSRPAVGDGKFYAIPTSYAAIIQLFPHGNYQFGFYIFDEFYNEIICDISIFFLFTRVKTQFEGAAVVPMPNTAERLLAGVAESGIRTTSSVCHLTESEKPTS
jgi:hypothetical protein